MKRLAVFLLVAATAYAASGLYIVQPEEQGFVRRCGKLVHQPREPGAHWGLPWPWDRVHRIRPREVKRVTVGALTLGSEAAGGTVTQYLTGDRNLINVRASVQYTIVNPPDYLIQTANVDRLIANAAESALSRVLSGMPVDTALTLGKQELGLTARQRLQKIAERYRLGVAIRSVDIGAVEPPPEVAEAFAKVVSALREREQQIHQAHSYANRIEAEARAESQRLRDAGRSDHDRAILRAKGKAERFRQLAEQYREQPILTSRRLYMQTMAETIPRFRSKLIIASGDELDVSIINPVD